MVAQAKDDSNSNGSGHPLPLGGGADDDFPVKVWMKDESSAPFTDLSFILGIKVFTRLTKAGKTCPIKGDGKCGHSATQAGLQDWGVACNSIMTVYRQYLHN